MSTESFIEYFLRHIIAFLIHEHPVSKLAVPAKTVTTQRNIVLTAEVGDLVRILPVPLTFTRLKRNRLHVILCSDAVEILLDKSDLIRIRYISHIDSHSYSEIILVSVLVACRILYRRSAPRSLCLCKSCHAHETEQES